MAVQLFFGRPSRRHQIAEHAERAPQASTAKIDQATGVEAVERGGEHDRQRLDVAAGPGEAVVEKAVLQPSRAKAVRFAEQATELWTAPAPVEDQEKEHAQQLGIAAESALRLVEEAVERRREALTMSVAASLQHAQRFGDQVQEESVPAVKLMVDARPGDARRAGDGVDAERLKSPALEKIGRRAEDRLTGRAAAAIAVHGAAGTRGSARRLGHAFSIGNNGRREQHDQEKTMARTDEAVIIEAAVNGVTSKATNPNVPETPEEIAGDALDCFAAGAAIVHNHNAEYAVDGARSAELYLAAWRPVVRERPDAILYPTLGFGPTITERYAHVVRLAEAGALRMSFVDTGSVNLGGLDAEGLPGGTEFVYANSFADIRYKMSICERYALAPSIAIFEPGFLRTALTYERARRMPRGAFVKLYFGAASGYLGAGFGLPPTVRALDAYLEMLEGSSLPWAVAVLGGDVVESGIARLALERGGHIRVGLEDFGGPRKPRNAELVAEVFALARKLGRRVAGSREAAEVLGMASK